MNTQMDESALVLEGDWTIARVAELKTLLLGSKEKPIVVDLAGIERIDLAVVQCLMIARRAGLVTQIQDTRGLYHRECERHGFETKDH